MCAASRLNVISAQLTGAATTASGPQWEYLIVRRAGKDNNICIIQLNRPNALNALFDPMMNELIQLLDKLETDTKTACVILTGSDKTFSAGADIKAMSVADFATMYKNTFPSSWDRIAAFKKPILAAVNGYCYGGGCEIAMMCDIMYAGDTAKFGQPEINIGTIPGAGGTQRLPRAIGKSKAMELVLTGSPISAQEAKQFGLVADVFPSSQLLERVIEKAEKIAEHSQIHTMMAKDSVNNSFQMPLSEGLHFEKRIMHSTFATSDQREGMLAFIQKRKPEFTQC